MSKKVNENQDIFLEMSKHPNTAPETLDKLADDNSADVRLEVARNPNTSPKTLDKLADDEHPDIRLEVIEHPNITGAILTKLVNNRCLGTEPFPSRFVWWSRGTSGRICMTILVAFLLCGLMLLMGQLLGQHPPTPKREAVVQVKKSEFILPSGWPKEAEGMIRQLGLTEVIASGKVVLEWGERSGSSGYRIRNNLPTISVVYNADNREMLRVLAALLMFAWQDHCTSTLGIYKNLDIYWPTKTKEGRDWIVTIAKDLAEVGPTKLVGTVVLDYDANKPILPRNYKVKQPTTNQAWFYALWYMGTCLLYTSPSPRDRTRSRMPSSA